ncbi:MAG TPA: hypothetical protein VIK91_16205 [Nannocystis sp.]
MIRRGDRVDRLDRLVREVNERLRAARLREGLPHTDVVPPRTAGAVVESARRALQRARQTS